MIIDDKTDSSRRDVYFTFVSIIPLSRSSSRESGRFNRFCEFCPVLHCLSLSFLSFVIHPVTRCTLRFFDFETV